MLFYSYSISQTYKQLWNTCIIYYNYVICLSVQEDSKDLKIIYI